MKKQYSKDVTLRITLYAEDADVEFPKDVDELMNHIARKLDYALEVDDWILDYVHEYIPSEFEINEWHIG